MAEESQQDQRATRRCVLLGVGLAGVGGALAGCSTAAVPYLANPAGAAPGQPAAPSSSQPMAAAQSSQPMAGQQAAAGKQPAAGGGKATGKLLGLVKDIPVGGGMIFHSQKVVVTQPTKGVFKAFSAICTHVGCECDKITNGTINCPCHGSEFKISDGSVVTGPAPSPLPGRAIMVTNGKILLQ